MIGLAESLSLTKPPLSAQAAETAQSIATDAQRMRQLVNNLLEMARIESGEVRLRSEWQPIDEVIGSALEAAHSALAHHRVEVEIAPGLPLVEFDAALIERVLYNLLENASKYTPAGSTVTVAAEAASGDLLVTVTDNGPGVPTGREQTIFEKFTRGVSESTTAGIGLGLAIARAIVEAHHGHIWAENVPGGGARFAFTLPLGEPPPGPAEPA